MDPRRRKPEVDPLGRPIRRNIGNVTMTPGSELASRVDMKELLKTQIGSAGSNISSINSSNPMITDANTASQADNIINYGFEDYEIYLDSRARDQISDTANGYIQWPITVYNGGQEIRNIVEVYISKFLFPRIRYQDSSAPDFFYYRRVFVEIVNTPTQSAIMAPNTTRFHFECEVVDINSQAVTLVPLKNTFFFRRPIDSLGMLQLRFSVPSKSANIYGFEYINIPNEQVLVNLIPGTNPAQFTIVNSSTGVLAPIGALPAGEGIAVYMSSAVTGNQNVNDAINSSAGVYVTNIIDATTFEVASIDATLAVAGDNIRMYIPKNRISISTRITSHQPYITNYIDISRP